MNGEELPGEDLITAESVDEQIIEAAAFEAEKTSYSHDNSHSPNSQTSVFDRTVEHLRELHAKLAHEGEPVALTIIGRTLLRATLGGNGLSRVSAHKGPRMASPGVWVGIHTRGPIQMHGLAPWPTAPEEIVLPIHSTNHVLDSAAEARDELNDNYHSRRTALFVGRAAVEEAEQQFQDTLDRASGS
jgi:hypothetical protein